MRKQPMLQAHRGVSTEYPENTMAAFQAAVRQGYAVIELDPHYTADNQIVILHDDTINRTARKKDGTAITQPVPIAALTYSEALEYDYGAGFSLKFQGEPLPLLQHALTLARETGVIIKLDSKIERFPPEAVQKLYSLIEKFTPWIAITTGKMERLQFYAEAFPSVQLHYDGAVDEKALRELSPFRDRLTVWLPFQSPLTSWVRVPFADEALCRMVKQYARLGIWIIKDEESFDEVCEKYAPDIVETTGSIKPPINQGLLCDMHVHSQNSHDSACPVRDMAEAALQRKVASIAVTDHCDIQYMKERDAEAGIAASVREARQAAESFAGRVKILTGVEIGEGIWDEAAAGYMLARHPYDVVIASVHAVRYRQYTQPYSVIDFSQFSPKELSEYTGQYFDDVLEMLTKIPCDILAHLTCPLRYINGAHRLNMDIRPYEDQIRRILAYIIRHAIAMEINTSGIGTPHGCFMPDEWIIQTFREMGGYLVTLGSDAHSSENIGKAFHQAIGLLKKYGFRHYYYYQDRINIQCTI